MKLFFTVILGAIVFNNVVFGATSLQSFYGTLGLQNHLSTKMIMGNRFKRSADLMAALCMQQCANTMKTSMETETSLDMKTVSNGLLNRQLFEGDNLEDFCDIYNVGRQCIDDCGDFPMKNIIHNVLKPIDYMCVVRFNEFQKYLPCLNEAAEIVADTCDDKCGGAGYAAESLQKMQAVTRQDQTLELMNDMCSHIRCSLDCELDIYAEVCESETPADLLRDFTHVAMKQSHRIMKQAGIDYMFPSKCKQLVRDLNKEAKERKETEKAIEETKSEVKPVIDENEMEPKIEKPTDPYLF